MVPVSLKFLNGTPVFEVPQFDPANQQRVYGWLYLPERGVYVHPAFYPFSEWVKRDLRVVFGDEVQFTEEATAWEAEQSQIPAKIAAGTVDPRFEYVTKPFDHQKESFLLGYHYLRSALLLEAGLGKTKVATDIIRHHRLLDGKGATLVIVPVVILYKWADEVRLHSGGQLTPVVIDGTPAKKRKQMRQPGDVYIVTYGTAVSMQDEIIDTIPYDYCIADESQGMRTHNSEKTKAAVALARKAFRRTILSGTPSLGDPRHLYGQLDFLAPFLHEKSYWEFENRYVIFEKKKLRAREIRVPVGFRNLDIISERLSKIAIRKKKDECLDLPERTFVTINYAPSTEQRRVYNELVAADRRALSQELRVIEEATATTRLIKLTQILSGFRVHSNKELGICDGCQHRFRCVTDHIFPYTKDCAVVTNPPASTIEYFKDNPKLDTLLGLLEIQLAEPTSKTIIWAHYIEELNMLEKAVKKAGYVSVRVDGGVSAKEVKARVDSFQRDPDCRVFLGQIASGVGIDLTAADYMIYYGMDYDLGNWLQSQDRAYRIGQKRNLTVYILLAAGSVEESISQALQAKDDISTALLSPELAEGRPYMKQITRPDLL